MALTFFKDVLFDLINECEQFDIRSINAYDRENRFVVHTEDGKELEIRVSEIIPDETSEKETGV